MKSKPSSEGDIKPIELLAPAGNPEAGYAALHYGADAVYLGLQSFSARASAVNFSFSELADIAGYAHSLPKRRKIYAAINTLILENELGAVIDLLAEVAAIGVDAVIIQDLGVLNILRKYFPQLKIHASTQMAIHNRQGVETAAAIGMNRVTLARELTLSEISDIAALKTIETEVFVHGALCYSYSGLCLFSSHLYGRSGNRGCCAYPCREWFRPVLPANKNGRDNTRPSTPDQWSHNCSVEGHAPSWPPKGPEIMPGGFIFSMKDLALKENVSELRSVGVTALKIEGRMKSSLYVAATVNYYRRLIDGNLKPGEERQLAGDLKTIFSRPWTDLYLRNRKNRNVIDQEIVGHRGSPIGKVEKIGKSPFGHCLRFKTELSIELHDGLQIDVAGQPRPFGFAVKNIYLVDAGGQRNKKRVFAAPENSTVEIPLPRGHPHIPLDTTIYSSSSQKVKRAYGYFSPKPGQFRDRPAADFEIRIAEDGFEVCASSEAKSNPQNRPLRLEIKKRFDGHFEKTRASGKISAAIENAFGRLGNTNLKSGRLAIHNPGEYFIPISLLNAARREISAALEQKIAEVPRQYAAKIKNEIAKKGLSLTEATEFTERDESRADMACKFLRERKIYRPYSFSVLSVNSLADPSRLGQASDSAAADERVRGRLNFKWSLKTDQPQVLADFQPVDWIGLDEVILECSPENSAAIAEELGRLADKIGKSALRVSLPIIMRQWEIEPLAVADLIVKGWHKWQIANPGGLSFLKDINKNKTQMDISADWPLYALNRSAVSWLKARNVDKITLSPEDGLENMRLILKEHASDAAVIVYQDTPLMISENCIFASEKCFYAGTCYLNQLQGSIRNPPWPSATPPQEGTFHATGRSAVAERSAGTRGYDPLLGGVREAGGGFRGDRKKLFRVTHFNESQFSLSDGNKIRIERRGCRNIVLNARPFCLASHLNELAAAGAVSLRVDFMYRRYSAPEALDLWRRLRSGARISECHPANFERGLQ